MVDHGRALTVVLRRSWYAYDVRGADTVGGAVAASVVDDVEIPVWKLRTVVAEPDRQVLCLIVNHSQDCAIHGELQSGIKRLSLGELPIGPTIR